MSRATFLAGSFAALFAVLVAPPARAAADDNPAARPEATKPPSSGQDLTGDHLVLKANVYGLVRRHDGQPGWIALRGTRLRVTQVKGDDDALLAVVESVPCVVERHDGQAGIRRSRTLIGVGGLIDCPTDPEKITKLVEVDEVYQLKKSELEQYGYFRSGWVYGALLVPYKYHFDDRSFSSAATIGPYLGYSMGSLGFETAFVGSVGLSSLAVANPNGSGDTSTIQGFSAAFGLIGRVSKNNNPIRLGILFGWDWAGSNSAVPYAHEGKLWGAVQIGFDFSQ